MSTATAEVSKPSATPLPTPPANTSLPNNNVPVSRIVPSPWNRKAEVSPDFIDNIRRNGVLQNVILRPITARPDHVTLYSMKEDPFVAGQSIYELVAGERRWTAARKAGRSHVPAAIRPLSDVEAMELQIDENDQRENFTAMQRAEAYHNLCNFYLEAHKGERGYTETKALQQVAATRKCEIRTVEQVISLKTKMAWQCQAALNNGEMTASHAYEIARRPQDEQLELLAWLRKETQHSQGDIPSVRRLKDIVRKVDVAAEDRRRQEKLFKDPQPGTSTSKVPTVAEAAASAKPTPKEWGKAFEKQGKTATAPLQTPKAVQPSAPKPLNDAQRRKAEELVQKEREARRQGELQRERKELIDRRYRGLFFNALVTKSQINSRFLTHIVPDLIFEAWDELIVPPEAFGHERLGWPAPRANGVYTYAEVRKYAKQHTRKFTPGLLGALIISLFVNEAKSEQLARYFGVDPQQLRKRAATELEAERLRIPEPKTPKDKVLFSVLQGRDKDWGKLRKSGASDKQIRELLCARFGEYGGHNAPNQPWIVYRGTSNNPRVWFKMTDSGTPDLAGAVLVAKVRELLNISQEGMA
jgi:ParB/RepB/Spo0J family partition protein